MPGDFFALGHPRIGNALLDLTADFAREHQLVWELAMPLVNKLAYGINRDPGAAFAAGEEAMLLLEQTGSTAQCWHTALNQAILFVLTGRWDDVAGLRDRPLLRERPPAPAQAAILEFEAAVIALARDDALDLALVDELAALGETGRLESIDDAYYVALRAVHARATGQPAPLLASCRRFVELALKYTGIDDDFPNLWTIAVDWTIDANDLAQARELLRLVGDVPPTRLNPLLKAQLSRLRGAIEAADPASATGSGADRDRPARRHRGARRARHGARPGSRAGRPRGVADRPGAHRRGESAPRGGRAETFIQLRATAWLRELDAALSLSAAG